MNPRISPYLAFAFAVSISFARADVKLPALISNHMVLEKTAHVPIWGTADPGENVTVTLDGHTAKATADSAGKWMTSLDLHDSAPGPFEMVVEGKNKLTLADVVVGEVWVASGQSNMEWILANTTDAEKEIAQSANPMIRQFLVGKKATSELQDDAAGAWVAASPATSGSFSAAGYYFAKNLQAELKVPVGLIHTSWGGSPSEAWTSVEAIDSIPDFKATREGLWTQNRVYPASKKAFVDGMTAWIKENGREDRPVADAGAFAGMDVSTEGWIPVKLPGAVAAPGIPQAGAVWLRKEIEIPAVMTGGDFMLFLPIDGYDSIYWNGKLIKQTTYQDYPGRGSIRAYGPYNLKPGVLKAGKNVLAIRLYEPVGPATFSGVPKGGPFSLAGEWLAKSEYEFPPLASNITAAAPQPPGNPPREPEIASFLFNGMIHPLLPYAIKGVIWYQGEFNARRAYQYRTAFPLLITDWRKHWKQGDFPFYFCQLPNFMDKKPTPGESSLAELREAQSLALKLPNTGMAVLIDVGEAGDVHPRNKKDVGERLASIVLARDYDKSIPFCGPTHDTMKIEGGKIILHFKHTHGGLVARPLPHVYDVRKQTKQTAPLVRNSPNSQLEGFAICGADRQWEWADAKIDGDNVVVWSDKVPAPVAVRYAWADNPTCNLSNGAGLLASPFRTDDFPPVTLNYKY